MVGPELIEEAAKKKFELIKKGMKEAQDRQKLHVDLKRRPLKFEIRKPAFVKISQIKGVTRFRKSRKLCPRYVGLFEVLKRVGDVAFHLALPPNLIASHYVFYISMLNKYIYDSSHKIDYKELQINDDMSY